MITGLVFHIERNEKPTSEGRYIVDVNKTTANAPALVSAHYAQEVWSMSGVTGWLRGYRSGALIPTREDGVDSIFEFEAWALNK